MDEKKEEPVKAEPKKEEPTEDNKDSKPDQPVPAFAIGGDSDDEDD